MVFVRSSIWPLLCLPFVFTGLSFAGALPPCVKAASSNNGNFLIITDVQIGPSHGAGAEVQQVALQVFSKETFINEKDRLTSSVTYWSNWLQWSVTLDSQNSHPVPGCPLPLITDDGEFLVIVNLNNPDGVLSIYRRRDHRGDPVREGPDHGVLIREVALKEIWPADKFPKVQIVTDHTPQWFAGGTFQFSPDSRALIHRTRWGTTVSINLPDGSVSRN
ncbi:MAG TPA: hypothetical protein VI386_07710 [Candidatus Sulfotelmatobacter sp.]